MRNFTQCETYDLKTQQQQLEIINTSILHVGFVQYFCQNTSEGDMGQYHNPSQQVVYKARLMTH
jgi:hypothetical protein